jgi:hypothetical protein
LLPSYLSTPSADASPYLALDVTIPSPPSSPEGASITAVTAITQHLSAERHKLRCGSYSQNRPQILQDLVTTGIQLLPFSLDHLGGIGPLGQRFLGLLPDPPPPPAFPPSFHQDPAASSLFTRVSGPLGATALLPRADSVWRARHGTQYFGTSYHSTLPSQWARQTLGLNATLALSAHLRRCIHRVQYSPLASPPRGSRPRFPLASRQAFHVPRARLPVPRLSTDRFHL